MLRELPRAERFREDLVPSKLLTGGTKFDGNPVISQPS